MCAEFTIHPGYILAAFALGWWLDESVIQLNKKVRCRKFQKHSTSSWDHREAKRHICINDRRPSNAETTGYQKKILPGLKKHQRNCQGFLGWNSALKWLYFTRKISQMMQDIHFLWFLWQYSLWGSSDLFHGAIRLEAPETGLCQI